MQVMIDNNLFQTLLYPMNWLPTEKLDCLRQLDAKYNLIKKYLKS